MLPWSNFCVRPLVYSKVLHKYSRRVIMYTAESLFWFRVEMLINGSFEPEWMENRGESFV